MCPGPAWCVVVLIGVLTWGIMEGVLDPSENTGWSAAPKPILEVSPEVNTGSKTQKEWFLFVNVMWMSRNLT